MTFDFRIRGIEDRHALRRQLESGLEDLNRLIALVSAQVTLERQPEVTPSYQAAATLAVSGPDIHAAARDHTWEEAWRKVVLRLREQINERQRNHAHPQSPANGRAGAKGSSPA